MIRFLILCIIFFLLYIAFGAIGEYDCVLEFSLLGYKVQTTIFVFASIFLVLQLLLVIILKLVFLVFDLPSIIRNMWSQRALHNLNKKLLKICSELLMDNRQKSMQMFGKIITYLEEDDKEFTNLILAEGELVFDKKVQHLRSIVDKKNYSLYAAKKLAKLFFDNSMYTQAEEYAVKAFNEKDTDTEIMLNLIRIYDKLNLWSKMVFIVSKLQRADSKLLEKHAEEIAIYYFDAAKSLVVADSDDEAMKYLESSLELKPDYIQALNLFMELSVNKNNSSSILRILKSAFVAKPCFEIAEMYAKCSRSSADAVYGTLSGLAKPSENIGLFLALAAYLGLEDKIREIKSPKLISYEGK